MSLLRNSCWTVTPACHGTAVEAAFASLDTVFELQGEQLTFGKLGAVSRVEIDGRRFYVKRYTRGARGLRRYLGPSRARKEWQNLLLFHELGLPAAPVVAYGEDRRITQMLRGALVTEEVPDSPDLTDIAAAHPELLRDPRWLRPALEQVAHIARTLHDHRFAHNDLKWRNILATLDRPPAISLIDCPSGGRWFGPMLRYRIIKDIACLDKAAKYHLSRTQRLRFYKLYRRRTRLTDRDKVFIGKVVAFFAGRE